MKKSMFIALVGILTIGTSTAQPLRSDYRQNHMSWVRTASRIPDAFFTECRDEAVRIADNLVLYQLNTGAWEKNVYYAAEITADKKKQILAEKKNKVNSSTIDNGSTTTEIIYLSKVYNVTRDKKYKNAALKGIRYLLDAQYENGGWPQFYPQAKEGYSHHITYNDDAMVNVMRLLQNIYQCDPLYWYVPQSLRDEARKAFDKGIECILHTQVVQNGRPTVWCAQHHYETLEPAKARSYELPSLSGSESVGIVQLLMSVPNPSPEVVAAVDNAIAWFKDSKIEGLRFEYYTDSEGRRDYRMVKAPHSRPLWARFYELGTNRPMFSDRDGIRKYDVSEIGHGRRTGYSWYTDAGNALLEQYRMWKNAFNPYNEKRHSK